MDRLAPNVHTSVIAWTQDTSTFQTCGTPFGNSTLYSKSCPEQRWPALIKSSLSGDTIDVHSEPNSLPLFFWMSHNDITLWLKSPETSHVSSWMTGSRHRFAGDFHNCAFVICDMTPALKWSVFPPRGRGGTSPGTPQTLYRKPSLHTLKAPPRTHTGGKIPAWFKMSRNVNVIQKYQPMCTVMVQVHKLEKHMKKYWPFSPKSLHWRKELKKDFLLKSIPKKGFENVLLWLEFHK